MTAHFILLAMVYLIPVLVTRSISDENYLILRTFQGDGANNVYVYVLSHTTEGILPTNHWQQRATIDTTNSPNNHEEPLGLIILHFL